MRTLTYNQILDDEYMRLKPVTEERLDTILVRILKISVFRGATKVLAHDLFIILAEEYKN